MPGDVKGLAMITAAAALALVPQAAVAKKPVKAKDRGAKVERTGKQAPGSAQQRCRDERKALGAGAFAAKYGKPRTKGSAKAKAKAARAAFGRCVSQTAKAIRAEREAEKDELDEDDLDEEELGEDELGEDKVLEEDAPEQLEKPELEDGEVAPVKPAKDLDADEPDAGLGDEPDLD